MALTAPNLSLRQTSSTRPSIARGSMMNKQVAGLTISEIEESLLRLLPENVDFVNENIIKPFCISDATYQKVSDLFRENLERGLRKDTHEEATVKMYPTYVREVPNGKERGKVLALDFGSHHLRLELVNLEDGKCIVDSQYGFMPEKLLLTGSGEELFDCMANFLHRFLKKRELLNTPEPLPMGFTFSFPCRQLALNKTYLAHWTKNIHCDSVIGHEVVGMLEEAIKRRGEMNIDIDAVVNDSTGTLMVGGLEDPRCAIGLVLSKGTNACYIENLDKVELWNDKFDEPKQVVIDTEWHGFGCDGCLDFMRTEYDFDLDKHSKYQGLAIFEKMVSGEFLGEIVRLVLQKLYENGVFEEHWTTELSTRERFYSKYVSEVLSEEDIRFIKTRNVYADVHIVQSSELECRLLHHICQLVSNRAAKLVAIGLAALLDRVGRKEVGIAVSGALFRFHPLFEQIMKENIPQFLKNECQFWFVSSADRSGVGAALAAAVAERRKHGAEPVVEETEKASGKSAEEKVNEEALPGEGGLQVADENVTP